MKMITILKIVAILFISKIHLVNAQPISPEEPTYHVTEIYGGFIHQQEIAVTISLCAQQTPSQCYFITLNRSSFLDLMNMQPLKRLNNDNPAIEFSAELAAKQYRLSNHDTRIILNTRDITLEQMTLSIDGKLVSPAAQPTGKDDYVTLRINALIIPKEKLHTLKSWLEIDLNGGEQRYRELSDCKLAEQMIKDTSPLFTKAIELWQGSASDKDFALWKNETFQPQYDALRQIYDPIDYRYNRKISKSVHEKYLLPIGDFVSYMHRLVSVSPQSIWLTKTANKILKAEYRQNLMCTPISKLQETIDSADRFRINTQR
ncbi:hypothetical protein ABT56_15465 [Photobacterium aquae]|uniref:Uncharacterized protein n=1 Tax=Photobacterium aquae TaxID=1195763 RepID=A0A0J1GX51_9GAMM|nr:hypothetical protein [Photobacterium aquae]KLV04024.1 hypothetical protein ABT56_15465 [Photobacterium aquae]